MYQGEEEEEEEEKKEEYGLMVKERVMEKRVEERWRRQPDNRCSSSLGFTRPPSSLTEQTSLSLRSTGHAHASIALGSSDDSNSVDMHNYEPNSRGRSNTGFSSQLSEITSSSLTPSSYPDNIALTSLPHKGRESAVPWSRPNHPAVLEEEEEEEEEEEMEPDSLDFTEEAGDAIERRQASMERRTRERLRNREAESLERRVLKERQRQREEAKKPIADQAGSGFNVYCVQYDLQDCWTINKLSGP